MKIFALIALALPFYAQAQEDYREIKNGDLGLLSSYLVGNHSNVEQYNSSQEFPLVDYSFCEVQVSDRNDERSLFVYGLQDVVDNGYQRKAIYRFRWEGEVIVARSFKLNIDPQNFCENIGSSEVPNDLINWDSSKCEVFYKPTVANEFIGETAPEGCPSTFMGSELLRVNETISQNGIFIWERWYNARGQQTFGARSGPYAYRRVSRR